MQKSKKDLTFPEDEPCRNCGAHLENRYCSNCGQDRLAGARRSFGRMVMDIGSGVFAFDAKTWVTIRKLLLHPGFLSKEYVSGRVTSYTLPIKLFWMMVLVFTFIFSFHDTTPVVLTPRDAGQMEIITEEPLTQNNVISDFTQYLPYFMLLIIPIFTALLLLFFRREKFAFSEHLIFAVHLHTIFFLLFTIDIFVSYLFTSTPYFLLIMCLYSLLAAIRFYHTRKKRSVVWRMLLIVLLYLIVLLTLLLGVALFFAWYYDLSAISVGT